MLIFDELTSDDVRRCSTWERVHELTDQYRERARKEDRALRYTVLFDEEKSSRFDSLGLYDVPLSQYPLLQADVVVFRASDGRERIIKNRFRL